MISIISINQSISIINTRLTLALGLHLAEARHVVKGATLEAVACALSLTTGLGALR